MDAQRSERAAGAGTSSDFSVTVTARELSTFPLFEAVSEPLLQELAPRFARHRVERGDLLFDGAPIGGDSAPNFLLLRGDVAIFQGSASDSLEISNYLSAGECYLEKLFAGEEFKILRVEASCPVELVAFRYQELITLFNREAAFRDQFNEMIARVSARQRDRFNDHFQRKISQFFVQERLTFSRRVKVKRMDLCIECEGCYEACRSRHGTDRLGSSEVRYGLTEVPRNCHDCVVPECIDKCPYGHITRSPESGEIVISDSCIGCSKCAEGCSFNAIQMHPVKGLDLEHYFPGRDPAARDPYIAQKCDNCTGYAEQACISACPTGALFEIDGPELFESWEQFDVDQQPGFAEVPSPSDVAQSARYWGARFTITNLIAIGYECCARLFSPELSVGWLLLNFGSPEAYEIELYREQALSARGTFGHSLGYVGGIAMLLSQLYYIGRRFAPRLGNLQLWMEFHVQLGFIGFIYGFYHTAFVWREPIAVATFTLLTLTIVSGVIGRYLVYLIPRARDVHEKRAQELDGLLQQATAAHTERLFQFNEGSPFTLSELRKELQDQIATPTVEGESTLRSRVMRWRTRRAQESDARRFLKNIKTAPQVALESAEELLELLMEQLERRSSIRRNESLSRVLKNYRIVHVAVGHLSFIALVLHIFRSLMYTF